MGWDNTQQGQQLNQNWEHFRKLYTTWLPQHKTQLQNIANRPLGG